MLSFGIPCEEYVCNGIHSLSIKNRMRKIPRGQLHAALKANLSPGIPGSRSLKAVVLQPRDFIIDELSPSHSPERTL